ncbi:MAG: hypothetical protein GXX96_33260 [Planctomycetaceae bacterium]|jgi:Tfp pilus assembly protein PilX|nr:hypothetical protein [Planctomycetaceae bacterium]
MQTRSARPSPTRRGSILVIVLISLLVASMLGLGLIKTVLIHRRQSRVAGGQQQAVWLAEAGSQRAVRQLADDAKYKGEVWEVPAEVLGPSRTATVSVEVVKRKGESNERVICVQVEVDDGRMHPIGYREEYGYVLPAASKAGESE